MSLPAYPQYKDISADWLRTIPSHWDVQPCRYFVKEQTLKNDGAKNNDYLSLMANVGVMPYEEKGDVGNKKPEDLSKCKLVAKGDLVINSMNYGIGSYGLSGFEGVCSPVYIVLRPRLERVEARFAFRIFENKAFQTHAQSFGNGILEHRAAINWDILKGINVALPPVSEQRAILSFLDHETAKIDALIAELEKLLVLLAEKRQATISHAVSKGLNPDVPMKDSGVEWLGKIPEHWSVVQLKHVINRIDSGVSVNAVDTPAEGDEVAVLKTSCVYGNQFDPLENKVVVPEEISRVSCPVIANTLIVSRMNTPELVGAAGLVKENIDHFYLPDRLWQVHFCQAAPSFIHYWSMTNLYRGQVKSSCAGTSSSMQNLSQDEFKSFYVALPNQQEQVEISDFLNLETSRIQLLTSAATEAIRLLKERRSALISAAVTGKIDVRNYQAKEAA